MTVSASDVDLERVDLSDLENFADGPPHEIFTRLRDDAPMHWNPLDGDKGFWNVTRHEDIQAISRNWEGFSSEQGMFMRDDAGLPLAVLQQVILGMDPPRHDKVRNIVQKAFTPKIVRERDESIRRLVGELIDNVIEKGECDFVDEIAVELPLTVIAEMLGVPHEDRRKLFDWTNQISYATAIMNPDEGMDALGQVGMYLAGIVAERQKNPGDDLVSRIIAAEVDGEKLTEQEVTFFFALLMFAGNDTTRNTASGGMLALIENPDQRQKLIEDPSLTKNAVEEMLRWVSPVLHFRRTATGDSELRGQKLEAGDKVVMWYVSGNRDAGANPDPFSFDVAREEIDHQAFGGGGKHFCLGNQLGRLELKILFEELLQRLPAAELSGAPERLRTNFTNELTTLPIRFEPGQKSG